MKRLYVVLGSVLLVAAGVVLGAIVAYLAVSGPGSASREGRVAGESDLLATRSELRSLRAELARFQEDEEVDPDALKALSEAVEESSETLERLEMEGRYRDQLLEISSQFSTRAVEISSLLSTAVTFFFTVVVIVLGGLGIGRLAEVKRTLDRRVEEIENQVSTVESNVKTAQTGIESEIFRFEKLASQERAEMDRTRSFVQGLGEKYLAASVVEILGALRQAGAIGEMEDEALRRKLGEMEARIFLRHPDKHRAREALYSLRGLGSETALPDLAEIVSDEGTDADLRLLAQDVVRHIEGSRKKSP